MIIPNGGFPPITIINEKKNIKNDNKNINIQKLINTSKSLIDLNKKKDNSLQQQSKIDNLKELDEL